VVRNKIKRRIRMLIQNKKGLFAVRAKEDISNIEYKKLIDDIKKAVDKIN